MPACRHHRARRMSDAPRPVSESEVVGGPRLAAAHQTRAGGLLPGLKGDFCDGHHIANATVALV